jgi:hypothetical protein
MVILQSPYREGEIPSVVGGGGSCQITMGHLKYICRPISNVIPVIERFNVPLIS